MFYALALTGGGVLKVKRRAFYGDALAGTGVFIEKFCFFAIYFFNAFTLASFKIKILVKRTFLYVFASAITLILIKNLVESAIFFFAFTGT